MTGHMLAFEFREGGFYRMRLSYNQPNHSPGKTSENTDEVEVRFLKLIADKRIEQVVNFNSQNSDFAGSMKITWVFAAVSQGTEVTVRCENVPEGIRPEDHEAGLTSTLENLAEFTE
jgi:Activator of Hsp90 ATPase homolog 1-like protein